MKIVLLTKAFPAANVLVAELVRRFGPIRVIAERTKRPAALSVWPTRIRARLADPRGRWARLEHDAQVRAGFSAVPVPETVQLDTIEHRDWAAAERLLASDPPDVLVSYGTSLLPTALFRSARLEALNIHAGLSPYYRGVFSTPFAILNDDLANVGATVHRLSRGIDDGEILAQARPTLALSDDEFDLENKVQRTGHSLLIAVLEMLAAGGTPSGQAVDKSHGLLIQKSAYTPGHRRLVRALVASGAIARFVERGPSRREKPIVQLASLNTPLRARDLLRS